MRTYSEPRKKPGRRGWWTRVYDPATGRSTWRKLKGARTERQAKTVLGRMRKEDPDPLQRIPFNKALEAWRRVRHAKLAQSTRDRYDVSLRRWLQEWGTRTVSAITARQVEDFHARLAEGGRGASLLNAERALLRNFFSWAVEHGYASLNPARTLKRARGEGKPKAPGRTLSEEEVIRLLRACREPYEIVRIGVRNVGGRHGGRVSERARKWTERRQPPAWLYPIAFLGARTLLRLGTLRRLRWDHMDLNERVFRIPAELLKTREELVVPLCDEAVHILDRLREKNRKSETPSMEVFRDLPDGRAISRALSRAAIRAGIKGRVGFHSLRRSGSTILLRRGVPLEVVQALGGWQSPAVLLKHYRQVHPEEVRRAVEELSEAAPMEACVGADERGSP